MADPDLADIAQGDFGSFIEKTLTPETDESEDDDQLDDELESDDEELDDDSDEEDDDEQDDELDEDDDEDASDEDEDEPPPGSKTAKQQAQIDKVAAELAETRAQLAEAARLAREREDALLARDAAIEADKEKAKTAQIAREFQKRWSQMRPEDATAEMNQLMWHAVQENQRLLKERDQTDQVRAKMQQDQAEHDEVVRLLASGARVQNGELLHGVKRPLNEKQTQMVNLMVWHGQTMQEAADQLLDDEDERKREARRLLARQRRRENAPAERSIQNANGSRRRTDEREPETIRELIDDIFAPPIPRKRTKARR